jgi:hypothetical protein
MEPLFSIETPAALDVSLKIVSPPGKGSGKF